MLGNNAFSLIAASEWWLVRWTTPFWIIAVGVLAGILGLFLLYCLIFALSRIPVFEKLQRNGAALPATVVISAILTAVLGFFSFDTLSQSATSESETWLFIPSFFVGSFLLVGCLLFCSNRRFTNELPETLGSGIGSVIFGTLCAIVGLGVLITFVVEAPASMLSNLPRIFTEGENLRTVTLDGVPSDSEISKLEPVSLEYNALAVRKVTIESDRNIILTVKDIRNDTLQTPVRVDARTPLKWDTQSNNLAPIPVAPGFELFAQNLEFDPAIIKFNIETAADQPEIGSMIPIGVLTLLIGAAWFLQLGAAPRLTSIALATAKSEFTQPLPKILMLFAGLSIIMFVYVPFHTLGEDIKLLKDCGISLIMVVCLFQGVWSASSSVSEEIEGRTALTLLSKPIHRRSFIFGKLLGILWILLLMVLVLGTLELLAVAYKPIYDAHENSQEQPLWQACYIEMFRTVPGLVMVFFQVATLTTLSVGIATRVPQLANFAICFSIYLIGHLTPAIVGASEDSFPIVRFVAQLIAVLAPNLDLFSMNGAIDANNPIPMVYVSGLFVYSMLFCGLSLLLGLLLFEDRDLA